MIRINVEKELFKWASDRSGLPREVLEKKFPKLSDWEEGEVKPTLKQVEAFAKTTHTPLGYLFLSEPPEEELPIPHFRTLNDKYEYSPSPEFIETINTMRQRQDWYREFLIDQGQNTLEFYGSATQNDDYKQIAQNIRTILGLERNWATKYRTWTDALRQLRLAIEEARILVVINGVVGNNTSRKLDVREFRGFVLADEYAPLIFVNGSDSKAAQMFTLAHELAHVWFGSSAAFDLRELQPAEDPIEKACNKIAAEFLVCENELKEIWRTVKLEEQRYDKLAKHFKVSVLVVTRRLLDLGFITKKQFLDFYQEYLNDERRKVTSKSGGGGNFYENQNMRIGYRFGEAIVQAAKEGKLEYYEAYKLTGLYGKTFDRYVKNLYGEST